MPQICKMITMVHRILTVFDISESFSEQLGAGHLGHKHFSLRVI